MTLSGIPRCGKCKHIMKAASLYPTVCHCKEYHPKRYLIDGDTIIEASSPLEAIIQIGLNDKLSAEEIADSIAGEFPIFIKDITDFISCRICGEWVLLEYAFGIDLCENCHAILDNNVDYDNDLDVDPYIEVEGFKDTNY